MQNRLTSSARISALEKLASGDMAPETRELRDDILRSIGVALSSGSSYFLAHPKKRKRRRISDSTLIGALSGIGMFGLSRGSRKLMSMSKDDWKEVGSSIRNAFTW